MNIRFSETGHLELINPSHAEVVFDMIDNNREHLKEWLTFVDGMQNMEIMHNFINGCMSRNESGIEYGYIIFDNNVAVGRNTIHKVDMRNRSAEIGYWLIPSAQSKGLITNSTKALLKFAFSELDLNRIEIRCGVGNLKSQKIPEKFGFHREGIMRDGEFLNGSFHNLIINSLLKSDYFITHQR
jgi:ribosomal-protein-serine acetyltransferase